MNIGGTEGRLGVDRILWRMRMQYEWSEAMVEQEPGWDQCCTCWVFALSESEARTKVWSKFQPPSVRPESIASCDAERFETDEDRRKAERLAA